MIFNKSKNIDPFLNPGEPFKKYKVGKKDFRVYFIEDHPQKEELPDQRLFHIKSEQDKFYILIEKELYNLIPDYYSESSLSAHSNFLSKISKDNSKRFLIVLVAIAIFSTVIYSLLFELLTSGLIGLFTALLTLVLYFNIVFQKQIKISRQKLRETLIEEHSEVKLDEMLMKMDNYINRRLKELAKEKEKH
ncbi:hypothetical protein RI065_05325 [Mycoplasmatota bacterium zrk1]